LSNFASPPAKPGVYSLLITTQQTQGKLDAMPSELKGMEIRELTGVYNVAKGLSGKAK